MVGGTIGNKGVLLLPSDCWPSMEPSQDALPKDREQDALVGFMGWATCCADVGWPTRLTLVGKGRLERTRSYLAGPSHPPKVALPWLA